MLGDGSLQTPSFTFIDECVEGVLRLTKSDFREPMNIGSDEMVSMNEMAEIVLSFEGKNLPIHHIPGPHFRGRNSDNTLIKAKLGWAPTMKLKDGLRFMYFWIKEQIIMERSQGIDTQAPVQLGSLRAAADGKEISHQLLWITNMEQQKLSVTDIRKEEEKELKAAKKAIEAEVCNIVGQDDEVGPSQIVQADEVESFHSPQTTFSSTSSNNSEIVEDVGEIHEIIEEVGEIVEEVGAPTPIIRNLDIKAGGGRASVAPMDAKSRQSFLRQVYMIEGALLFLAICVAFGVTYAPNVPHFFFSTIAGIILSVILTACTLLLLLPLNRYRKNYPINWILLIVFTILAAFEAGMVCTFPRGKFLLITAMTRLTSIVGLFAYTFYASRRGVDFQFWTPFISSSILTIFFFGLFQELIHIARFGDTLYVLLGAEAALVATIFARRNLDKYEYDDYLWAAYGQYLDFLDLCFTGGVCRILH